MNSLSEGTRREISESARARVRELADAKCVDPFTIGKLMVLIDRHIEEVGSQIQKRAAFTQEIEENHPRRFLGSRTHPSLSELLRFQLSDPVDLFKSGQIEDLTDELHYKFVEFSAEFDEPWGERIIDAVNQIFPSQSIINPHLSES